MAPSKPRIGEKAARKMGKKTDALHDGIPW